VKIIQIGVGGFGNNWLNAIAGNDAAEMVALVDLSEEALAAAREKYGWSRDSCYTDLSEALAKTEADLAVVVTPPAFHRGPVIEAMEAGLDVLSEKPMAETREDCRAMMQAASDLGRTYTVSQNYRYNPAFYTMARMIREGVIGEVGQVKIDFYKGVDFGGGFRHEMDNPVLVDMSIHHFDLIRFVTGLNPETAQGSAWNPGWSNYAGDCSSTILFTMSGGARVLYNASWCAKGDFCDWNGNWQIEGEKGTLLYANEVVTHIPVEGLYKGGEPVTVELDAMERMGQAWVLNNLIECRATGGTPETVCTDNIHSVAMVFAAVDAVESGNVVPVES
jgi:predicted dehydrogenase